MPKTHGEGYPNTTPEYRAWGGMVNRCTNPNNHCYHRYGGAGIRVCDRWRRYENFLADMGRKPSPKHSIDRIDGNKGYSPENCRWATKLEQARNRRSLKPLVIGDTSRLLCEWSEISGIDVRQIWARLKLGWSPQDAVFAPLQQGRPTHCQNGHELAKTARWEEGSRRCTTCKREYDAKYYPAWRDSHPPRVRDRRAS